VASTVLPPLAQSSDYLTNLSALSATPDFSRVLLSRAHSSEPFQIDCCQSRNC